MTRRFSAPFLAMALAIAAGSVGNAWQGSAGSAPALQAPAPVAPPVNINTAGAVDLEKLPGVGPAMAARIIEYRQKNGAFKKVEELMNVKGIGEKSFLALKPLVTVTPPKVVGRPLVWSTGR